MWILLIALQSGQGLTTDHVRFDTQDACLEALRVYHSSLDDKLSSSTKIVLQCVVKGDVLEKNNLTMKDVGGKISTKAREFYMTKLKEV